MIRTETEYKEAVKRRDAEKTQIEEYQKQLESQGISPKMIEKAMQPYESFRLQLVEEIEGYERIKRGVITDIHNLGAIGQRLIGIRIYLGLSQRELAQKLGVHESQVSRDEKNEYHGITVERVEEILTALGVSMNSSFDVPTPKKAVS
ncbi:helix-turn-helix transcriptional regulator [Bdellovibrionota bacterium FG-2]